MSQPTQSPRQPKPGDPFANPNQPGAHIEDPSAPKRKVKVKKGRRFFLLLLLFSGMLAVATIMFFANSKSIITDFYAEVVVPRSIPEALPAGYPVEKARMLVDGLRGYFSDAQERGIADETVLLMMERIETALQDRIVTDEEVDALMADIQTLGPDFQHTPAPQTTTSAVTP
jgi:hypothetical protein